MTSAPAKLSAQKLPSVEKKFGGLLEPRSSNLVTRLAFHQDDAGVIAQTRTVGERANVIEQALGGGVCS